MKFLSCFLFLSLYITIHCNGQDTVRICQLSDPQLGLVDKTSATEIYNLKIAVNYCENIQARVITTGDLLNNWKDFSFRDSLLKIVTDRKIPVELVPGNHDLPLKIYNLALDSFHSFASDLACINYDYAAILMISSQLLKTKFHFHQKHLQYKLAKRWLKAAFNNNDLILVFQHHPYFVNKPDEKNSYDNLPGPVRKKYLNLFRKYNVAAVFSGHLHKNLENEYDGIRLITTGSTSKNYGMDEVGIRVITIIKNNFSSEWYNLNELK